MTKRSEQRHAIRERIRNVRQFVVQDMWDIELSSLSSLRAAGVRFMRIVHLAFRGFREDQCPLHASALTYTTLMAIVPVLALTLWVARGMGGEELIKRQVQNAVQEYTQTLAIDEPAPDDSAAPPEQDGASAPDAPSDGWPQPAAEGETYTAEVLAEQINYIVEQAFVRVGEVSFAAMGGVGLAVLLWMVLNTLSRVEFSFNRVWGIRKERSLWRKFTDYLSVLFVLPVLIVAASTLPVADLLTRFMNEEAAQTIQGYLGADLVRFLTVLLLTTLALTFMIAFLPNTRVRAKSAVAGGLVAAILFLAWLRICATLQVGVARQGAVYGSFAVVPILLAWVYVSWLIVLFGTEVAFATQNYATYNMERGSKDASLAARLSLAVAIILQAARSMLSNSKPFQLSEYAAEKNVPMRFLNDVVAELTQTGYLGEMAESAGRYTLLKSPEAITVGELAKRLLTSGKAPGELGVQGLDPAADDIVEQARKGIEGAWADVTVKELLGAHPV